MNEKVLIGKIVRAHGLKGAVRIRSLSDFPDRILSLEKVFVGLDAADARPMTIAGATQNGDMATAIFEGVATRNDADALVGRFLFIDESEMPPAPEGRQYIHDLIGMKVVSDDGRYTGTLTTVYPMPAAPVYGVDVGGREVLIPAVPAFIEEVNMETRTITVRNMPGLFGEEES